MITFEGLFVPSITIVLPAGRADLSGVVMLIFVGSDLYAASAALAEATDPEPDDDDAFVAVEPEAPELEELDELDEPHAASERATASMPKIAASPRTRVRPSLRRSSVEWCYMWVSFGLLTGTSCRTTRHASRGCVGRTGTSVASGSF